MGELLVEMGGVTEGEVAAALAEQRGDGRRLGEILVARGSCGEEVVAQALGRQLNLPCAEPPLEPEEAALALVDPVLARSRRVLPLSATPRTLRLAMSDPLDMTTLDDIQFQTGRKVEPAVATPSSVELGLARGYGGELRALVEQLPDRYRIGGGREGEGEREELERAAQAAPVVRLVDHILARAVAERASDIHLEEDGGEVRVRYRVDGVLRKAMELPPGIREAVISRIKIMASMDIAVKRRPQDGSFSLTLGTRALDLRVSTLPVTRGEKAVIRILDQKGAPDGLAALGMAPRELHRVRTLLRGRQGVILSAGPTGSGKSTTLFAALGEVDREGENVVTLEDPVEYRLPGTNQVQVSARAGLTFPAALRSVLRQDPDTVMVGEIRDRETAEIAMAAAITGHLVLSTIHTTDAPGAITRLLNMGVPPYLVAGGLSGVIGQRLLRRACARCRGKGARCTHCSDGYLGRVGVFQVLVMTDPLRDAVVAGAATRALVALARDGGMGSMAEDARRKVAEGLTTPHEMGRVLHSDPGAARPCDRCGNDVPFEANGCPGCGHRVRESCGCGTEVRRGWRYCPSCLRKLPPPEHPGGLG